MASTIDNIVGKFPFRHVPLSARQEIADILDPSSSCGLSWEYFAERLNCYFRLNIFTPLKIKAIDSRIRDGSPTMKIFSIIESSNAITTDIVQKVLIDMSSAATDVLPRYIDEIATNASNEVYPLSRLGHPHSCHCESCIHYCKSLTNEQFIQPSQVRNGHGSQYYNTNTNRSYNNNYNSAPPQISHQSRNFCRFEFESGNIPIRQQCPCRHRGNRTLNNNDLGRGRFTDNVRRNVRSEISNIAVTENQSKRSNQQFSSSGTTSNNPSESEHAFENDSVIIERQNQLLNQTHLTSPEVQFRHLERTGNSYEPHDYWCPPDDIDESDSDQNQPTKVNSSQNRGNNIDCFPLDVDDQSDSDLSMPETVTEQSRGIEMSHDIINQSPSDIGEIRQNKSQTRKSEKQKSENIQEEPQYIQMMQNGNNNAVNVGASQSNQTNVSGKIGLQCTCFQEENRLSLPIMRPRRPDIRKKCVSESDIVQNPERREELEHPLCTCKKRFKIFISYAIDNRNHMQEVYSLQATLREKGYIVKSDMNEGTFQKRMENSHDWLEEEFLGADFVIFCISPEFYKYTQPDVKDAHEGSSSNKRLHTRFIFDLARSEYVNNESKNKRFLPVVFSNSGADYNHLPIFMWATIVYYYPETIESLFSFLDNVK